MNGNISKRKGFASSVDADNLNYISEKVSEKLTDYADAVSNEQAARTEADKALEGEILKKQDKLTFDTAPTAESENPVTSGGIKDELDKKVDKADGKVLSSNDFTDEDKAKLDKKVDKADGMGLSKIKDISLEKMTIASSPGGVLAKCEMLDIETQSGEKISASYVPETHLMEFGHPDKCVTKRKLSDELQAEMDKISTKADKSDTYTKDEVDSKINSVDLSGKQDLLIFDTTPTENSENPVTSGGVKAALDSYVKNTDYADSVKGGVVKISHPGTSYLSMYEGSLSVDVSEILSQYKIEQIIVGDSAPTTSTFISKQGAIDEGLLYFDKTDKNAYILTQVGHGDEPSTYVYEWKKVILEDDLSDYVKNTDYATSAKAGIVKVVSGSQSGVVMDSTYYIKIYKASNAMIDAKQNVFTPIVPANLDYAVRAVSYNAITASTDEALLLGHRTETRLTSADVTALTLTMPTTINDDYECSFSFKSGAAATTLTYSSTPIIWKGADCDSDGDFIPMPNTIYEVGIKHIGNDSEGSPIIVARVGVC